MASGSSATGTSGSVSYSIGQVVYAYHGSSVGSITEGVQQAFEISEISLSIVENSQLQLLVYPNPSVENLNLNIGDLHPNSVSYQLFDALGRLLQEKNHLADRVTSIPVNTLPVAIYFLKIHQEGSSIKTFKIIKNR